jgi:ribonuclease PH
MHAYRGCCKVQTILAPLQHADGSAHVNQVQHTVVAPATGPKSCLKEQEQTRSVARLKNGKGDW